MDSSAQSPRDLPKYENLQNHESVTKVRSGALKVAHDAYVKALEEGYETEIRSLHEAHEQKLSCLVAAHELAIRDLRRELAQSKNATQTECEGLKAAHRAEVQRIKQVASESHLDHEKPLRKEIQNLKQSTIDADRSHVIVRQNLRNEIETLRGECVWIEFHTKHNTNKGAILRSRSYVRKRTDTLAEAFAEHVKHTAGVHDTSELVLVLNGKLLKGWEKTIDQHKIKNGDVINFSRKQDLVGSK